MGRCLVGLLVVGLIVGLLAQHAMAARVIYYGPGYDSYTLNRSTILEVRAWSTQIGGDVLVQVDANAAAAFGIPQGIYGFSLGDSYGMGGTRTDLNVVLRREISPHAFAYIEYFSVNHRGDVIAPNTPGVGGVLVPDEDGASGLVPAGTQLNTSVKISAFDIAYGRYIGQRYYNRWAAFIAGVRFVNFRSTFSTPGANITDSQGTAVNTIDYRLNAATGFAGFSGRLAVSDRIDLYGRVIGMFSSGGGKRFSGLEYELGTRFKLSEKMTLTLGYRYINGKPNDGFHQANIRVKGVIGGLRLMFK